MTFQIIIYWRCYMDVEDFAIVLIRGRTTQIKYCQISYQSVTNRLPIGHLIGNWLATDSSNLIPIGQPNRYPIDLFISSRSGFLVGFNLFWLAWSFCTTWTKLKLLTSLFFKVISSKLKKITVTQVLYHIISNLHVSYHTRSFFLRIFLINFSFFTFAKWLLNK
jgi:hypothetical protein